MKKIIFVICTLAVFLVFSSNVLAEDTKGVYAGIVGGFSIPSNIGGTLNNAAGTYPPYDPSLKNGYLLGAKVGWLTPFTDKILALELEYNHIKNDFDKAKRFILMPPAELDLYSAINIDLFMFNAIARYPQGKFHPYLGLGLGLAYVKTDDTVVSHAGEPIWTYDGGSDGVFAYQIMTGIDVDITKNIILGLTYKYIGMQEISFGSNIRVVSDPSIVEQVNASMDYHSHNIIFSICYLF